MVGFQIPTVFGFDIRAQNGKVVDPENSKHNRNYKLNTWGSKYRTSLMSKWPKAGQPVIECSEILKASEYWTKKVWYSDDDLQ